MLLKVIHKMAGFLLLLLALLLGVILVGGAWSGDGWARIVEVVSGNRWIGAGVGLALILLCFIYVLSAFPRRKNHQKYLSFDGEGGTVSISTASIAEYVARVAGEFPSIVKIMPEVIPARKTIDIHAFIHIKDSPDIHDVCELLQKRIREVLAGSLGITEVRRIEVSVKDIIAEFNPD